MRATDRSSIAAVAVLLLLFSRTPAGAQPGTTSLAMECDAPRVDRLTAQQIGDKWMAYFPDSVIARLAPELEEGRFDEAVQSVRRRFLASGPGTEATPEAIFFAEQLESLAVRLGRFPSVTEPIRSFNPRLTGFADSAIIFPDAGSRRIVLTEGTPGSTRRAFCWSAIAAGRIVDRYSGPALDRLVARLDTALQRWDAYSAGGFSQYPWELAINGVLTGRGPGIDPPSRQWIVLHPSVAVQLDGSSFSDLRRFDALPVEVLGHLWYNRSRTSYMGLSLGVAFSSDRSPGVGPLVHVGRNISFGPSWTTGSAEGRGSFAFLFSADLYKALAGVPGEVQRQIRTLETRRQMAAGASARPEAQD